jgi:hypothetical protein
MADFRPFGRPHAIPFPTPADLEELRRFAIEIQRHLSQFTPQWAAVQADCPRASYSLGGYGVPQSTESFALQRRREVASIYRQMIRLEAQRLWKPGMKTPPETHRDHERDITDVMVPWIMEQLSAHTVAGQDRAASKAPSAVKRYERQAYLSYVAAIQSKHLLANGSLRKVYDWIEENGVTVDGAEYELPSGFPTWRKYRSAGERQAKSPSP